MDRSHLPWSGLRGSWHVTWLPIYFNDMDVMDLVGLLCRLQNVVLLAEAGCLDPRIFCTSCMVSHKDQSRPVPFQHVYSTIAISEIEGYS